jgi:preprotein translocase subunit SecE
MITKSREFIEDVRTEMKKVNWPERNDLLNSTYVVIVISFIFTVIIFAADWIVSTVVNLIY